MLRAVADDTDLRRLEPGGALAAVRRSEILACESDIRAWIIAPGTSRPGARALGARV